MREERAMAELPMLEAGEPLLLTHLTAYQGSTWVNAPEAALLLFRLIFCIVNLKGCDVISLLMVSINLYLRTSD